MVHIQWKDRYNINFREIDAQHRGLLDLVNQLSDMEEGVGDPAGVPVVFHSLCSYALTHFSTEERYLQAAGYPGLAQQCLDHKYFADRLVELSQAYGSEDPALLAETRRFVQSWYMQHILESDHAYASFLKNALPTEPIEAVLFGLGGVLCRWDPGPLVQHLAAGSGKPEAELRDGLAGPLAQWASGAWPAERVPAEWSAWLGSPCQEAEVDAAYCAGFQPVPAMVSLARRLGQNLPVALVGDAAPCLRAGGFPAMGLAGVFRAEILSCEVGALLPDGKLFQAAAARLGKPLERCLLIHPDPVCLEAGHAVQLQTLPYTNPVMLMAELRRMGLAF